jgi:hypothetical protein
MLIRQEEEGGPLKFIVIIRTGWGGGIRFDLYNRLHAPE